MQEIIIDLTVKVIKAFFLVLGLGLAWIFFNHITKKEKIKLQEDLVRLEKVR